MASKKINFILPVVGAEADDEDADDTESVATVAKAALSLPALCPSCGSGGQGVHSMISCDCCGEQYHHFCLGLRADVVSCTYSETLFLAFPCLLCPLPPHGAERTGVAVP